MLGISQWWPLLSNDIVCLNVITFPLSINHTNWYSFLAFFKSLKKWCDYIFYRVFKLWFHYLRCINKGWAGCPTRKFQFGKAEYPTWPENFNPAKPQYKKGPTNRQFKITETLLIYLIWSAIGHFFSFPNLYSFKKSWNWKNLEFS